MGNKKYVELGILTEAQFLNLLRTYKGDLSNLSYEVTQNTFLSNYELIGKQYFQTPLPYGIKLGKGRFSKIFIYDLALPALDFQEASFKNPPEITRDSIRAEEINFRGKTINQI